MRGCRGWVGLRRDSLHWACLPVPSLPVPARPCPALSGFAPGAGPRGRLCLGRRFLSPLPAPTGAADGRCLVGSPAGLLSPLAGAAGAPLPPGLPPPPSPPLPSPRWRVHARLREASRGNGRRETRGGVEGNGRRRGALRVELPAGRSGAALRRRRAFSGRTARGADTLPRGIGEGRKPLSSGKQVAGSLPRGPEPAPGPAVRSRCCGRHRVCSRLWNMGVTLRV